ncbi:hypothetical protein KSP40_PGU000142 [Platanthera guangdongensis]|uniref:Endonuclease/exonuclease/phosphatase domain-containing protein n=1 Tax=Platanthera guangdongensis TaxID=2320717 RepID=A0ABR2M736_9ASPA
MRLGHISRLSHAEAWQTSPLIAGCLSQNQPALLPLAPSDPRHRPLKFHVQVQLHHPIPIPYQPSATTGNTSSRLSPLHPQLSVIKFPLPNSRPPSSVFPAFPPAGRRPDGAQNSAASHPDPLLATNPISYSDLTSFARNYCRSCFLPSIPPRLHVNAADPASFARRCRQSLPSALLPPPSDIGTFMRRLLTRVMAEHRLEIIEKCLDQKPLSPPCPPSGSVDHFAPPSLPTSLAVLAITYAPQMLEVRVLLDRAYTVSKDWNDAPVIVCGDFNSTPMSSLYKFIATQKLNLLGLARDQVSGQYSATVHIRPNYGFSAYSCHDSGSAFGTQEGYYRPNNQHYMENSFAVGSFTGRMGSHCQLKTDRQMSFDATAIKLGEVEIFSHQSGGISSAHSKLANIPSRKSEIFSQQSVIRVNREADKNRELGNNREETQKNTFGRPCFEDHEDSPGSGDLAGGIKLNSLSCIDNSAASLLPETVNLHDVQNDSNHVVNTSSFHRNRDLSAVVFCDSLTSDAPDLNKILHIDGTDDTLSKERPSTSYASLEIPSIGSAVTERADPLITCFYSGKDDGLNAFRFDGSHLSDSVVVISPVKDEKVMENMNSGEDRKNVSPEKILQKMPTLCCNLGSDATSAENRRPTELSCLEENEDSQSLELSGLEENADPNFLKDLLGMEDENHIMKDFNSSELSLHLASTASDKTRCLYNPYCWSPEEMEIASGKQNCTIVEHSLKLRSVYRDVEPLGVSYFPHSPATSHLIPPPVTSPSLRNSSLPSTVITPPGDQPEHLHFSGSGKTSTFLPPAFALTSDFASYYY